MISLLWVIGIGVLPAAIAGVRTFSGPASSGASHTLTKIGLFYTHVPLLNKFLLLALAVFVVISIWGFIKRPNLYSDSKLWWWFSAALLIGTFLVFVQQIVTGIAIWPQHFVQYSIPVVYIVGVVSLYKFLRPWSRSIWLVCTALILISSAIYGSLVVTWYQANMPSYLDDQRYVQMYAWLNAVNTKKDCVVLISENENYLSGKIPAYTRCDVYYSVQNYYGVPQERIEHGYLSWLRLRGITSVNIVEYLNGHMAEVRADLFTNWLELWHASQDPWLKSIRNEKELNQWEKDSVQRIATDYRNFLKGDYKEELNKYKLDYIVWDSLRYPEWNPKDFPFLSKVLESNGLVIYRMMP